MRDINQRNGTQLGLLFSKKKKKEEKKTIQISLISLNTDRILCIGENKL